MQGEKTLKRNKSGYSDPTAFNAILKADRLPSERIDNVLEDIYKVCKNHGLFIYGDIAFVDRKTRRKGRKHLYYYEFLNWEKE